MIDRLLLRFASHARVIRFLVAGSIAMVVNLATLAFLTEVCGVHYLASSVGAFVTSFLTSFTLQKFWTFQEGSTHIIHHQLLTALLLALTNLGVNTLLLYLFVEYAHVYYLLAQTLASALIACESFFVYRYVIFTAPR